RAACRSLGAAHLRPCPAEALVVPVLLPAPGRRRGRDDERLRDRRPVVARLVARLRARPRFHGGPEEDAGGTRVVAGGARLLPLRLRLQGPGSGARRGAVGLPAADARADL